MLQGRVHSGRPGARRAGHCASAGSVGTVQGFCEVVVLMPGVRGSNNVRIENSRRLCEF
jgi:hypothetical protein